MNRHAGSERNLTLVMDLYELTMAYNYFKQGNKDQLVYFDMFYRKTQIMEGSQFCRITTIN